MNSIRLLVCATLVCMAAPAVPEEFSGKVIAVMDGDTLLVLRGGHPAKVRLAGIDAPEKAQPYGSASLESLAAMLKGKEVKVASSTVDDYGRLIATVYAGETNVNREQVRRGMAWEYSRFHNNKDLLELQRDAQEAKRGLWADKEPLEPSKWRKQHPLDVALVPVSPAPALPAPAQPEPAPGSGVKPRCEKKRCSEFGSCEEARRYFTLCARQTLDGDADGKPCESLCAPAKDNIGKAR